MSSTSTTFRIIHPNLAPDEITDLLGMSPDIAHQRGDSSDTEQSTVVFPEGVWGLRARTTEEARPEDQLRELLTRLEGHEIVLKQLKWRGYRLDFFVGVFEIDGNTGLEVSADTLRRIGELGADLDLDLYSYDSDP
jgi:uncharacterized protein DUF4279